MTKHKRNILICWAMVVVLLCTYYISSVDSTFAANEDENPVEADATGPAENPVEPEPSEEASTPTPDPTPSFTPTPTIAEPTKEPTKEPTQEVTQEPTKELTKEPTKAATTETKPTKTPANSTAATKAPTKEAAKPTKTVKPTEAAATEAPKTDAPVYSTPTPTLHPVLSPAGQKKYKVKASGVTLGVSSTPPFYIDGEVDSIWSNSTDYVLQNTCWGTDGATADFKAAWDEENLYLLIHVKDKTRDVDNDIITRKDCVEIYLDQSNTKPSEYTDGCQHFYISRDRVVKYGSGASEGALVYAIQDSEDEYYVEARIHFEKYVAQREDTIGLDIRVNDSQGYGERDYIVQWSDTSLQTHVDLSHIGSLVLR